jgi:hypothetical protein
MSKFAMLFSGFSNSFDTENTQQNPYFRGECLKN